MTVVLKLYTNGNTVTSVRALHNIRQICDQEFNGRYRLDVIDIREQPELAIKDNILAIPTLIKELPEPLRKLIGDFSNRENVLAGLDIMIPDETITH